MHWAPNGHFLVRFRDFRRKSMHWALNGRFLDGFGDFCPKSMHWAPNGHLLVEFRDFCPKSVHCTPNRRVPVRFHGHCLVLKCAFVFYHRNITRIATTSTLCQGECLPVAVPLQDRCRGKPSPTHSRPSRCARTILCMQAARVGCSGARSQQHESKPATNGRILCDLNRMPFSGRILGFLPKIHALHPKWTVSVGRAPHTAGQADVRAQCKQHVSECAQHNKTSNNSAKQQQTEAFCVI